MERDWGRKLIWWIMSGAVSGLLMISWSLYSGVISRLNAAEAQMARRGEWIAAKDATDRDILRRLEQIEDKLDRLHDLLRNSR